MKAALDEYLLVLARPPRPQVVMYLLQLRCAETLSQGSTETQRICVLCGVSTVMTLECSGNCAWRGFHRAPECPSGAVKWRLPATSGEGQADIKAVGRPVPVFKLGAVVLGGSVPSHMPSCQGACLPRRGDRRGDVTEGQGGRPDSVQDVC